MQQIGRRGFLMATGAAGLLATGLGAPRMARAASARFQSPPRYSATRSSAAERMATRSSSRPTFSTYTTVSTARRAGWRSITSRA